MDRSYLLFALLVVWVMAILAPPIITLMNDDGNTVISMNLNEEEQQELGKKNVGDKPILDNDTSGAYLLALFHPLKAYDSYLLGKYDLQSEIVLPPPKLTL
ncbi:hypothetical protein [Maribacter polysaccharolyticus]|uniref:hypothetical protein n=1 Tax=Maribacter polysaccharolyticus TaxID=3020831 RepID=UPI00237F2104|nr:hypothetical protein [Maribacter polysaccharolyticus]MDE3743167.1 hypothetical protein [Maribacter polysaccharolyticus]